MNTTRTTRLCFKIKRRNNPIDPHLAIISQGCWGLYSLCSCVYPNDVATVPAAPSLFSLLDIFILFYFILFILGFSSSPSWLIFVPPNQHSTTATTWLLLPLLLDEAVAWIVLAASPRFEWQSIDPPTSARHALVSRFDRIRGRPRILMVSLAETPAQLDLSTAIMYIGCSCVIFFLRRCALCKLGSSSAGGRKMDRSSAILQRHVSTTCKMFPTDPIPPPSWLTNGFILSLVHSTAAGFCLSYCPRWHCVQLVVLVVVLAAVWQLHILRFVIE